MPRRRQRTEVTRPHGVNKDLSPYELPLELWSDAGNVSFRRMRTASLKGYENPFQLTDTLVSPLTQKYFTEGTTLYWFYADGANIYRTDGSSSPPILAGSGYSATREDNWVPVNFNGLILFNNVNNVPQVVDPTTSYTTMIDLPNWAAPSPWGLASRAEVIRPYKNYLLALNCYDDTGAHYGNMVRWSSPAESGDAPPSWDPVDPAEQAGLYPLADTLGDIVDGLTLGDYFVVYKTDSVWLIQFVGGSFVFSFRKLFGDESGCIARECVAEFDGKHFVLSPNGAYIHDGTSRIEIMEQWVKDEFFDSVAKDRIEETRVVADHINKEIWIYWTSRNSTTGWPDRALTWNWETKKWSMIDLPGISYIAEGIIDVNATSETWDSDPNPWDTDETIWNNDPASNPTLTGLLMADPINNVFYKTEFSRDGEGAGTQTLSFVKRIGIDFGDDRQFKYVTRIVPHVIGEGDITVKVFAEDVQTGNPTLIQTSTFNAATDQDVDCHVVGRYIGIQFEGFGLWTVTGYSIEWEPAGYF